MNSYIPYNFIFLLLTILGTIFSISSSHWIGVWAGLEINLLGFIPMLVYGGTTLEVESGVKYFIIQSMGSGILLTGRLLIRITALSWANFGSLLRTNYLSSHLYQRETNLYGILVLISLLIKVGLTPFHFWLPRVMSGLSWLSVLLLASWQKIAPLILILMVVRKYSSILIACCAAASVVGGIGGLNQTQLRRLIAYSSINHLGWIVAGRIYNVASIVIYFAIYFLISVFLFYYLWIKEKSQTRQLSTSSFRSTNEKLVFRTLILSLGGLPPLLGFVGKWLILTELFNIEPLILIFLILGSLIRLFYYLLLFFRYFFRNNSKITEISIKNYTSITVSMYFIVASISINFSGPIIILWLPSLIL